jgi:hypothetical protein
VDEAFHEAELAPWPDLAEVYADVYTIHSAEVL